jgi:hypothetical protein
MTLLMRTLFWILIGQHSNRALLRKILRKLDKIENEGTAAQVAQVRKASETLDREANELNQAVEDAKGK